MRKHVIGSAWIAVVLLLMVAAMPMWAKPEKEEGPEKYSKDEWKVVKELLDRYQKDRSQREAVGAELDQLREMNEKDYQKFMEQLFKVVRSGGQQRWSNGATLNHPKYPGKFNCGGLGKGKGLILVLHGGGAKGNPDRSWGTAQGIWSGAIPRGFGTIIPRVFKQADGAWNVAENIGYVDALIRAAKRDHDIDTNRVYVVGHSMGGGGAWGFGHIMADEFAGFVAGAGAAPMTSKGPAPGVCENLYNSRGWIWHSTDDKNVVVKPDQVCTQKLKELQGEHPGGYEFVYKEYTNIGHGFPKDGLGKPMQYITQKQRDPFPKKVVFCPTMQQKNQLFWFQINTVEPVTWYQPVFWAENDGKNTITVTGTKKNFTIYFHPDMVDYSQPVKIIADGTEVFNGEIKSSMGTLLETAEKYYDPKMYFTAKVVVP
jgi:dienelactone hydrolase